MKHQRVFYFTDLLERAKHFWLKIVNRCRFRVSVPSLGAPNSTVMSSVMEAALVLQDRNQKMNKKSSLYTTQETATKEMEEVEMEEEDDEYAQAAASAPDGRVKEGRVL